LDYEHEKLLRMARSQLPEIGVKRERLEIPRLHYAQIGMRTVIYNFKEVAVALDRDPQHLLKFLTGEMATAATVQGSRVIFQGKFSGDTFQKQACGARSAVKRARFKQPRE